MTLQTPPENQPLEAAPSQFDEVLNSIDDQNKAKSEQAKETQSQQNHEELANSLNNLLLATMVSKDPKMLEVAKNLADLLDSISKTSDNFKNSNLQLLPLASQNLAKSIKDLAVKVEKHSAANLQPLLQKLIDKVTEASGVKPIVNVPSQKVSVDTKPIADAISEVKKAIKDQKPTKQKEVDMKPVTEAVNRVTETIAGLTFPSANYVLPFKDSTGKATQITLNPDGTLPVTGGSGGGGTQYTDGATAPTHPVGGAVEYVNSSGNWQAVGSSNPLPVSASVSPVTDNSPATQTVTAQDSGSSTATGANSQPITTGTPSAGSVATFAVASRETILVMVSGTWTGSLTSEGSFDGGITWVSKAVKQIGTAYTSNGFTANFAGAVNVAGLTNYRIRATAAWTGTATALITLSTNAHSVYTANNTKLEDSTVQSITNTIKAANTAPTASDTALVVAQSPNGASADLDLGAGTITDQARGLILGGFAGTTVLADSSAYGDDQTTNLASTVGRLWNASTSQYNRPRSVGPLGTQAVAGNYLEVSFSTTTVQAVANTEVSAYKSASVHITSQGTGSIVAFQQSNDNTNWVNVDARTVGAARATGTTGSFNQIFILPISARYFRLNVTGISAGTTAGVVEFTTFQIFPTGLSVGNDSGNMSINAPTATGSAVPANAFFQAIQYGANLVGIQSAGSLGDAVNGSGIPNVMGYIYNGATYDRLYSASGRGDGNVGGGVAAVGGFNYNGTSWDRIRGDTTNGLFVQAKTLTPGIAAANLGKAEDAPHTSSDVGVSVLGVRNDNAATSMTDTNGDYGTLSVDIKGTQFTRDAPSNTAAKTAVTSATTSTTLLAANPARRTAVIYNSSTSDMYLSYGGTASSTSFSIYVPSLATVTIKGDEYAGALVGIWITANGNAYVTETSI